MYTLFTTVGALAVTFVVTSVTISPAEETGSVSNIPPMYAIHWGSDEDIPPEALLAMRSTYICEPTPRGHAAMEEMLGALGSFSFTDNDAEKHDRAEIMYGLAKKDEQQGVCRWSDHTGYVYGSLHSTPDYDLSVVPCTTLPNGICAYIQPIKDKESGEVAYSLFTDTDDAILYKEIFGGEQWALIR